MGKGGGVGRDIALTRSNLGGKNASVVVDLAGIDEDTLSELGNLLVEARHERVQSLQLPPADTGSSGDPFPLMEKKTYFFLITHKDSKPFFAVLKGLCFSICWSKTWEGRKDSAIQNATFPFSFFLVRTKNKTTIKKLCVNIRV